MAGYLIISTLASVARPALRAKRVVTVLDESLHRPVPLIAAQEAALPVEQVEVDHEVPFISILPQIEFVI